MVALFCCLLPAFSITGEHPVLIISSYNPDAGRTSGNISDFMEEFQRLGGTNTIALENMNCKSFSESPLWERRMAELLAKYQGDKSPALIVLIGQEAWAALSFSGRLHMRQYSGSECTVQPERHIAAG